MVIHTAAGSIGSTLRVGLARNGSPTWGANVPPGYYSRISTLLQLPSESE